MYSRKDTLKDHIRGKHILPKHVNIAQLIGVVPASKLNAQWLDSDSKRRLLLNHMLKAVRYKQTFLYPILVIILLSALWCCSKCDKIVNLLAAKKQL